MPCDIEKVVAVVSSDPRRWAGEVRVYIAGKTGEVLFSCGLIPALRQVLPRATLTWVVGAHYHPVFDFVRPDCRPDAVETYPVPTTGTLASRISTAVVSDPFAFRGIALDRDLPAWQDVIRVNLYRTHPWYSADKQKSPLHLPFYKMFAEALGLPKTCWRNPATAYAAPTMPVAFVSGDEHARLARVPLMGETWARIGPGLGIGHSDDGDFDIAGWTKYRGLDLGYVLEQLSYASFVIGPNSGIVFAALLLTAPKVPVVMIDSVCAPRYEWSRMPEVVRDRPVLQLRHSSGVATPWLDTKVLSFLESVKW